MIYKKRSTGLKTKINAHTNHKRANNSASGNLDNEMHRWGLRRYIPSNFCRRELKKD